MSIYPKTDIDNHLSRLLPSLKDALFSVEVAEKVHQVAKQHGFTSEDTSGMAEEIGYVILGLTRPNQFLSALQNRLDIDEDEARDVVKDVYHQIFFPIRQALKDAYQVEIDESALQEKAEDVEEARAENLAREPALYALAPVRIARMSQEEKLALPDDALNSPEVIRALWLTATREDLSVIGRENYAMMSAMNVYADNLNETDMAQLQEEMGSERVAQLDAYFQTNIAQGLGLKIGWHRPKKWIPPELGSRK